jgi:stress response protein YsnF
VDPGRPAVEADFQERTLEVTETDEEAVVAKRVRVTEEVVVRKDVAEHEKVITDTLRRTEVDVVNTGTRTGLYYNPDKGFFRLLFRADSRAEA